MRGGGHLACVAREAQMGADADMFFGWGRLSRSSPDGQVGCKPTC